jgi:sulfur carrier protein ThiS
MAQTEATFVVRLRVAPTLRHRLPAFGGAGGIPISEIEVHLPPDASVQVLAHAVGLDVTQMGLVCVVNGQVVHAEAKLQSGDAVRLMLPLAGG